MTNTVFSGKLAIQQRVLPVYRAPFFDTLAPYCEGGLSVFAGTPKPIEAIANTQQLIRAEFFPGQNQHIFHPRHPLYFCRQPNLFEWLESWNPNALIIEANPRYLSTQKAIKWMHQRGRPVLGWGLGAPTLTGPFAGWRTRSRTRLLHKLDGVIAYSRRGAAEYQKLGLLPNRVFVAFNAAKPRPQAIPAARPAVTDHQLTILFVGRLQRRKRLDLLLDACAELPDTLQPRLIIVGDGPVLEESKIMAQKIYPAAEFMGSLHGEALQPFFNCADLFVLPGTGGLAVQEAMANGLPVIVAQGDGTQDDLVRPENGWQIEPGSLQALIAALTEALSNPKKLREMGHESYRIAKEEINLEAMAEAFVNALNSIQN